MTYDTTYYERNKEAHLEANKKWRAANPEKVKETQRRWKEENEGHTYETPEGYVKYIGYNHPAAAPAGITNYHRIVLWDKLNGQDAPCHWCEKPLSWSLSYPHPNALLTDHVNVIKNDNRPENLVPTCHVCNVSREGGQVRTREKTQVGPCDFEGCENEKASKGLCSAHYNQAWRGIELKPVRSHVRSPLVTDTHKHCTGCDEIKPWSEFYIRKGKPKGQCKKCEIKRIQTKRLERLETAAPCSEEGCEKPSETKKMCQMHYLRQWAANKTAKDADK